MPENADSPIDTRAAGGRPLSSGSHALRVRALEAKPEDWVRILEALTRPSSRGHGTQGDQGKGRR